MDVNGKASDSALNRYGFLADMPESSGLKHKKTVFDKSDGSVSLGDAVTLANISFASGYSETTLSVEKDEDWIGFGDVTRERMYHRGYKIECWVKNVNSYVPVPFFMSTKGYAVLVNSTHRIEFDMAAGNPEKIFWRDHGGRIDFYLMTGGSFQENIRLYTALTGKPKLPPLWSFGLWYICREQANDYEVVNDALNFRREEIPCDVIGLEPGWMENKDDLLSTDKKWNYQRFPIPAWCPNGPHNFIDAVKRMGFHFELWERNEYDLSYEEERRLGKTIDAKSELVGSFHVNGETDDHFLWPRYADKLTKKEEPWFEHHKKFIDQGADFFKQDGTYQICPHPDRLWGNGMLDAEMHNLYPLFYARQMWEGFRDYAKRRPVVFTVAGWTGFQAFAGTWTGDVGGRIETLGSMLNTAVMGHNWCTNDMEVMQPEGIHFGYLQPWSQINSWTYFRMPWVQGDKLLELHKFYSRLRSRLIPYIYSWARQVSEQGLPLLMRPLQIEFEGDPNCDRIMHEYLLGRDLLVSIYKKETYLPEGRWIDFWSGAVYEGGKNYDIVWPEERGGNLFLREGAIVPFGPVTLYRGEKPLDEIELRVFPGKEKTIFELYEDDGISFDYLKGKSAVTEISCMKTGTGAKIGIAIPKGSFKTPENRNWTVVANLDFTPHSVMDGKTKLSGWSWDSKLKELRVERLSGAIVLDLLG
jgi:alpha-glucosidase (family GH31 glycosyl hydrolase)